MHRPQRPRTRSMLERIEEVEEPVLGRAQPHIEDITHPEISLVQDVNIFQDNLLQTDLQKEVDVSEMLTQKIDTLSQQVRKRKTANDNVQTVSEQVI